MLTLSRLHSTESTLLSLMAFFLSRSGDPLQAYFEGIQPETEANGQTSRVGTRPDVRRAVMLVATNTTYRFPNMSMNARFRIREFRWFQPRPLPRLSTSLGNEGCSFGGVSTSLWGATAF